MIIACKAAPARCSVAAIVADRVVNTSIASLSMRWSRSARSRPQGGKPSYAEDRRIIRAIRDRQTPRTWTGRAYATPVLAFGSEDGLVVGVLYGTTSDWVETSSRAMGRTSNGTGSHVRMINRDSSAVKKACRRRSRSAGP